MNNIDLVLNLIDRSSSQSDKIKSDLARISAEAKKLEQVLGMKNLNTKFTNAYMKNMLNDIKTAKSSWQKLFDTGRTKSPEQQLRAGVIAAGGLLKDSIEGTISMLLSGIGKALDMFGKGQETMIGLKYQAGPQAENVKKDVGAYASITGSGQTDIISQLLPLLQTGLKPEEARQVREAANDVSVMIGEGNNATQEMVDVFRRIQLKEGLQARQLIRMGIQEKDFYDQLGKSIGVTHDTAKKMASKGKIPDAIRNTLLTMIANKEGGKTGNATNEWSKSFNGIKSKFGSLPQDFMTKMEGSPAWKGVSARLGEIYEYINPDGPKGKKILDRVTATFEKILTLVKDALAPENVEAFFNFIDSKIGTVGSLADALKWVVDNFNLLVTAVEVLGVVWVGAKLVSGFTSLMAIAPSLAASLGAVIPIIVAFAAPILAVAAALGSVYFAYVQIRDAIKELGGWDRVTKDLSDYQDMISGKSLPAIARGNAGYAAQDEQNQINLAKGKGYPTPQFAGGGGKSVNVTAPISIVVEGGMSQDDTHTHEEMARQVKEHISRALEQSVDESGN